MTTYIIGGILIVLVALAIIKIRKTKIRLAVVHAAVVTKNPIVIRNR